MSVLATYLGIAPEATEARVLRLLIELGAQFVGAAEGSLLVVDAQSAELVFAMTAGNEATEKKLVGQRVPLGEGLVGLAAQTQEVQIGAPTFDVPGAASKQTERASGPTSVIAAPMLIGERLVGVITAVSFDADKRFRGSDALLYGRLATVAAVVVEQRRKLAAIEALQKDELPEALGEDERVDREIVASVQRLSRIDPSTKARVAALLTTVESLVAR